MNAELHLVFHSSTLGASAGGMRRWVSAAPAMHHWGHTQRGLKSIIAAFQDVVKTCKLPAGDTLLIKLPSLQWYFSVMKTASFHITCMGAREHVKHCSAFPENSIFITSRQIGCLCRLTFSMLSVTWQWDDLLWTDRYTVFAMWVTWSFHTVSQSPDFFQFICLSSLSWVRTGKSNSVLLVCVCVHTRVCENGWELQH